MQFRLKTRGTASTQDLTSERLENQQAICIITLVITT